MASSQGGGEREMLIQNKSTTCSPPAPRPKTWIPTSSSSQLLSVKEPRTLHRDQLFFLDSMDCNTSRPKAGFINPSYPKQ
mmetsp:Transcript_49329/g.119637  ORF Transcript_49329/g.119637 Transcript_49329/m.119637 type:complete len:80 (-) Transcript_49329:23-262(-)